MKKVIVGVVTLVMLSGCSHLSVSNFQKSEHSAVKDNRLAFFLIRKSAGNADLDEVYNLIRGDANLLEVLRDDCDYQAGTKIASAPLAPVAVAMGKLLFDLFMDNQVRQIEGLKKAAQGSYEDRRLIAADELRNQSCALALRYKQGESDYGLVALLKLTEQSGGRSFVIKPLYARAKNSVVVTEKPSDAEKPATIGVAVGMSLKAVPKPKPGRVPSLQSVGEGVVSIPKLALGPKSEAVNCYLKPPCAVSDLIPYPEPGNDAVSVTLSVAEVGKISIDFDQSIAETIAVKEALGPVLKDTIKESTQR